MATIWPLVWDGGVAYAKPGDVMDAQFLPNAGDALYTAPFAMGGGRVVVMLAGALTYADPGNPGHAGRVLGVTTHAAAQGAPINVRASGILADASFSFPADAGVYLGADGVPVALAPIASFIQRIGVCVEPGVIRIALEPAIRTI